VAIADSGNETLTRAAWAVDGLSFVTAGDMLRVRDRASGAVLRISQPGASPQLVSAAWSPNGQAILTVGIDRVVRIWDPASLTVVNLDTGGRSAIAAAWSATGRYFVVGFEDGGVGVYTTDSLQQPLSLPSFRTATRSVAWSPDGQRFAALSTDGQVRIFSFYPDDVIQRAQEINARLP
jgi:WD40 repeat protein